MTPHPISATVRRLIACFATAALLVAATARAAGPAKPWSVGEPIVTYWAGPPMSEAACEQMVDGGFNVVWCNEKDLDLLAKHKLRGMVHDPLLAPATLDDAEQRAKLDALIDRVKAHPAMYSYFVTDEPSAAQFPALGKLFAHLRERDPAHLPYLNLFPTYATNDQLGTKGGREEGYREYLRQFVDTVKPALISYDNYQFYIKGDGKEYFRNLAMVRKAAQDAGVPFLNIIQAAAWAPDVRVPNADETRYLVYTTLAYGASGISYYVYYAPAHRGGIAAADGTPTPIYATLKTLNREFVAIARELAPLRSLAVYHTALKEPGCEAPPAKLAFRLDATGAAAAAKDEERRGLMLGVFGPKPEAPSAVMVVNLDYKKPATATLTGPGALEWFDATAGKWSAAGGAKVELKLAPGEGTLVRLAK
jgi:hypothetical protein